MPFKKIFFVLILFLLHGCKTTDDSKGDTYNNPPSIYKPSIPQNGDVIGEEKPQTVEKSKDEISKPSISQDSEATAEDYQGETQLSHLNTYDDVIKCIENLGLADKDAKKKFKDNLSQLENELSPIVEHAKPISLSLMIFNGKVPQKCLNKRLVNETH